MSFAKTTFSIMSSVNSIFFILSLKKNISHKKALATFRYFYFIFPFVLNKKDIFRYGFRKRVSTIFFRKRTIFINSFEKGYFMPPIKWTFYVTFFDSLSMMSLCFSKKIITIIPLENGYFQSYRQKNIFHFFFKDILFYLFRIKDIIRIESIAYYFLWNI